MDIKKKQSISGESKIIKSEIFNLSGTPFVIGAKDGMALTEPEINVRKQNDTIIGIDIQCVCGKIINIDCR